MRSILIAAAALAMSGLAGAAYAQTPMPTVQSCPVTPCTSSGVPSAAPGGEPGSGPAALRTEPQNSPVATGAGSGGSEGTGKSNGGSASGGGSASSK